MKIIRVLDKEIWRDFVKRNKGVSGQEFLLSPEWFEIVSREGEGNKVLAVVRDLDYGDKGPQASDFLCLIVLIRKPLGKRFFYWYAPRGPLFNKELKEEEYKAVSKFLFLAISRIAKKALFLKIEPAVKNRKFWNNIFPKFKISPFLKMKKVKDIQPRKTVVLNLEKDADTLLKEMHQKTRYNIRLAKKKGVEIKEGTKDNLLEFWRLMQITSSRDSFKIHSKTHYQNLLVNSDFIKLYFAVYDDKRIAAALVCFFGSKATYLHGASDNEYRKVMAPHLLQWEIIKRAQEKGIKLYDFYGIDEKKWPGVTRFKKGFSKDERKYAGTFDVVFRPAMYKVYRLVKFLMKILKK